MNYCTFPDCTKVAVEVINTEWDRLQVRWVSKEGLVSDVWVPAGWVTLKVNLVTV